MTKIQQGGRMAALLMVRLHNDVIVRKSKFWVKNGVYTYRVFLKVLAPFDNKLPFGFFYLATTGFERNGLW